MNEVLALTLAAISGVALGGLFFGGLWWTVRKGMASSSPAIWFLGSMLLRTAAVLTGFYFVGSGDWQRLLACLGGFLAARIAAMPLTRRGVRHGSYL